MILPYILRLLCVCFASFFLIYAALSLAAWTIAPPAIRLAESMKPRFAARFLLAVRLLPVTLGGFVVAALCVPSYLWLEPDANAERVSVACCTAALLGAVTWTTSLARVLRAMFLSIRYRGKCEREGQRTRVSTDHAPIVVMETERPLLALAGIFRPRIVVSRGVLQTLSPDQFDAAIEHERAHQVSRDNLKRLLLLLASGFLPFSREFAALDRSWTRFTEWAADDRAAAGDSHRSFWLASALVCVARMGTAQRTSLVISSLIEDGRELSIRVDRLLRYEPPAENSHHALRALLAGISFVVAGVLVAVMMRPATLYSVHRLLERLIH